MRVREVVELEMRSVAPYRNPYADVAVHVTFAGPSGVPHGVPAFYDGDGIWRVRFSPNEAGRWWWSATSRPADPGLAGAGTIDVEPGTGRGFLRATPGDGWGFAFESGEPVWIFGDTAYNLFGMAHCGLDVDAFLRRRAAQGFNVLRVRVPVSRTSDTTPDGPPAGWDDWQTRSCWPWGGTEAAPQLDRFNLEWFRTVDRVVQSCERLGMGLELIAEAWGNEFPFNRRGEFTAEREEQWVRYLIARYDAYAAVWFWTPLNEYEYYPAGEWRHSPEADEWAMRVSRWIKEVAAHGHVVSAHNAHPGPPFAKRFAADPEAIDAMMIQTWGTIGEEDGWLAAGIEDLLDRSLAGWRGSAVLAEYGYERNPDLPLRDPPNFHRWCDADHTRRGAWRAAFCGYGLIHGFENSWGPWALLDSDLQGLDHLLVLRRFLHDVVPFAEVRPAPEGAPLMLADADRGVVAAYLPAGGRIVLRLPPGLAYTASWFDPRTGELTECGNDAAAGEWTFTAPSPAPAAPRDSDWALVLRRTAGSREDRYSGAS